MKHSKLPWKIAKTLVIRDGYPGDIARCLQHDGDYDTACANAAFIVTACNEYDRIKAKAELLDEAVIGITEVLAVLYEIVSAVDGENAEIFPDSMEMILENILSKAKELK